ncbi:MAG TPA: hypothetical protein VKA44_07845 [Gemmatimonadota bacterium]|nr:hypothetical protein [Gemmatimonadota bacterium]
MRGALRCAAAVATVLLATAPATAAAQGVGPDMGLQDGPKVGGSPNVHVLSHLPLGGFFAVADIEMEQDPARPFVYVSKMTGGPDGAGTDIVDVSDPSHAKVIYRYRIENPSLHQGSGGMDGKYFQLDGRVYYVQSFQFQQGTPDGDLGAVVLDVTGLPDAGKVEVVATIRNPDEPGGFHNIFAYRHSDGRALLFATVSGDHANIYDLARVVGGHPEDALVARIPDPVGNAQRAFYHDFYVGYDAATRQDKFYGAGGGGYFVYDVTKPETPKLLTSIQGVAGVTWGHTFTPDPNGRFAVTETEYQYAPLRLFDLKPGLDGKVSTINHAISAWTPDWRDLPHNHEVRWPYVFVSAYEDGLQVFSMYDPEHPKTVGWYYTCGCKHEDGYGGWQILPEHGTSVMQGAFGIDVRNEDGLVVLSDSNSGLWVFRMDGFSGWNGRDWDMPNLSSVQDWEHGPAYQAAH